MNTIAWEELLVRGVKESVYPCYAAAVGCGDDVYFRSFDGYRALFPQKLALCEDTLFDMAFLTKLMGTTMATLRLIEKGKLNLNDNAGNFFEDCHGNDNITVHQLMTHTSGISAYFNLENMQINTSEAADAILSYPLAAPSGTKVIYSCMGYILLGKIIEKLCSTSLDKVVKSEVLEPLGLTDTMYFPDNRNCAASENICSVVHDENARFLGGAAGNAGLFSTLDDVIVFAKMLSFRGKGYISQDLFDYAISDHTAGFSDLSRGLGFQLYSGGIFPGGSRLSKGSFGHTGFTGTSLYVDKSTGVYCVLLTNRVHLGRETPKFFEYRRAFYDTVFSDLKEAGM